MVSFGLSGVWDDGTSIAILTYTMNIENKAAIVTGSSSGIGAATAVTLAGRGAKVTLCARGAERLERVAATIRGAGGDCLAVECDITDDRELTELFEASQRQWGRLDILVNAAGIGRPATLHDGATEDWRAVFETNVIALCAATREALGRFSGEGGHVVHVSSMSGYRVPPGRGGCYAATKHAVRALTESLRNELRARGSQTRVTEISPGLVATGFFEEYFGGDQQQVDEILNSYRILDPEDVAAAVVYAVEAPDHVAIHDVLMRPNEQRE